MTPYEFIAKWRASALKERSASQEHFIDLCRLLDEPTPAEADPAGETYCFERGARKDTGGDGWADVWKRHHFAWEYKGQRADLDAAFGQLRQYALALENPPLLIVSDMLRFRLRTNWTNSVSKTYEFGLDDLADAAARDRLKWAFSDPERLRPGETRRALTERAAESFAAVAQALRERRARACRRCQGALDSNETAERGRAAVPGLPRPPSGVYGARPGLRLGQLPVPGAAGPQGPGAPGAVRGGGARLPARVSGGRPGQRQGHRGQSLRGRVGPGVGLDRRDSVDAAQRLLGGAQPDTEAARHHRVPGRDRGGGGQGVVGLLLRCRRRGDVRRSAGRTARR